MKKIINAPADFVDEVLEGIVLAYGDKVRLSEKNRRVLLNNQPIAGNKVGIVTAGGSGHLPVFLGYVGKGMLDGCTVGNVFASPSAAAMADMIRECNHGAGVLCLYGNYGGDVLNLDMAREEISFEDDIETTVALVRDDVASSPAATSAKRRGVAGMVYAFKIAGAAAENGKNLAEVTAVAEKALANTRTMGVALTPCVVPDVGKPTFQIADDEIEVGMGIHGEPGIEVRKMMSADEIASTLLEKILADMPISNGDEVSVMVNGLGATPLEEQLLVYRKLHKILQEKGVKIFMPHIGEFATSMEMAGLSVSVIKLDDELESLLRAPASTPFYTNSNK
ncbi:dihydroxyacetone kinase [Synergistales bacterium]|nr:dihydroxyacetone kinase [Synergistales bacterium]